MVRVIAHPLRKRRPLRPAVGRGADIAEREGRGSLCCPRGAGDDGAGRVYRSGFVAFFVVLGVVRIKRVHFLKCREQVRRGGHEGGNSCALDAVGGWVVDDGDHVAALVADVVA